MVKIFYKIYKAVSRFYRYGRLKLFKRFISDLPLPIRILDVGGTEEFWKGFPTDNLEIWIVNIERTRVSRPNFKITIQDTRDLSIFKDKEFDLVFSNSTIEHLGDFHSQQLMAKEIRRLGKRYFIQTPSRYFFIEPHFVFSFLSVSSFSN